HLELGPAQPHRLGVGDRELAREFAYDVVLVRRDRLVPVRRAEHQDATRCLTHATAIQSVIADRKVASLKRCADSAIALRSRSIESFAASTMASRLSASAASPAPLAATLSAAPPTAFTNVGVPAAIASTGMIPKSSIAMKTKRLARWYSA